MTETSVLQHHGEQLASHAVRLANLDEGQKKQDTALAGLDKKLDRLLFGILAVLATSVIALIRHA